MGGERADDGAAAVAALPPGSVLLHVGPHKTGSTAVQQAMHAHRDVLAAHDVHYAGQAARPRRALWSLGVRGMPVGLERPPERHWHRLVEEVGGAAAAGRRVLLSNEDLGRATEEQAARVVGDLSAVVGADAVHVLAVGRRYDRYLPSQWQERVKGGEPRTFTDWLAEVLADDGDDGGGDDGAAVRWAEGEPGFSYERVNVWFAHDTAALARRWAGVVGPGRVTVAVGDERDHRALPDLVEAMLGLAPGTVPLVADRSNRSLVWAETELVRAVNERLAAAGLSRAEVRPWSGRTLVPALSALPPDGDATGVRTPPLPAWAAEPLRRRSDARVDALRALADPAAGPGSPAVRLVGDADDLRLPADLVLDDPDHPAVPPPARTEAAAAALAAFALHRPGAN